MFPDRLAWAMDLGGLPFDPAVRRVVEAQRATFSALGCAVEAAAPDVSGADEVFKVLRAWAFEATYGELVRTSRGQIKETVIGEVERGARLTGPRVSRAEIRRTALYDHFCTFFQTYEFLVLPTVQAPPFPVEQEYVAAIAGQAMETYIDWMQSCYIIAMVGHPAISAPCGFTPDGLPVGVQIVGRRQEEWHVLQFAHAFEQATGVGQRRPPLAR